MKKPGKREDRLRRILTVLHEYLAAETALGLLEDQLKADPSFLDKKGLRNRIAIGLRQNLETTYLVRIFAEFEAGLRDVWENAWDRKTEPPMSNLLDAIAARRSISQKSQSLAHRVRRFRNALVHSGGQVAEALTIQESHTILRRFFSKLPADW